jgi:hypothetical protein
VADDTDQAQRWESVAKVRVNELEQALGLGEPTQLKRSEGDQSGPIGQSTLDGSRRRLREQDLTPMGSGADTGYLMHGKVDVTVPDRRGLTRVHPDPHSQLDSRWPRVCRKRSLALQTGGDRFGSVGEDEEERIPLGADLHASMVSKRATKQRLVDRQNIHIPLAEFAKEASRALDIGYDEGDDPGGQPGF